MIRRKRILFQTLILVKLTLLISYLTYFDSKPNAESLQVLRLQYETNLAENLVYDNGTGCPLSYPNPFSEDYFGKAPDIICTGPDWVKCRFSTCRLQPFILKTMKDIKCTYQDILYKSDKINYVMGQVSTVKGGREYHLRKSDHVKIFCVGKLKGSSRYNIVGDGTSAALIPILSGKTFMELKESRVSQTGEPFDQSSLIFGKLANDGYRTAFFEDSPNIATFSYKYNGFAYQPTDHYIYSFDRRALKDGHKYRCIGDTPQFKLMLNLTEQFAQIDGKHFIFCFIVDICHDNYEYAPNADEPLVEFLKGIIERRQQKNTLIIIMSDHGQRFGIVQSSPHGFIEERLPFMAIRLPDNFKERSPESQMALESNADVLTTPHDIYSTFLDVIGLPEFKVDYKVKGAVVNRGLSVIKPIPANRSCSEAGVLQVWCTCNESEPLTKDDPLYERAAQAILDYINRMTISLRSLCAERTLISIDSVRKFAVNENGRAKNRIKKQRDSFYVKITCGPGIGRFEGHIEYLLEEDRLQITSNNVFRRNAYGHEPHCVDFKYPHLNDFCYCKIPKEV